MGKPVVLVCAWAAVACAQKLAFQTVTQPVIQQRLERVAQRLVDRRAALEAMFREVGCEVTPQAVPHSKAPNLICALRGETESTIVAGGHYDHTERGLGAVDDWSGTALLPSLYQSLSNQPRHHRFVFIGFAAEETGLIGSKEYVKRLAVEEKSTIRAMINLECLGLSPPKVWASRADKELLSDYFKIEGALQVRPDAVNVEKVGDDDSHPFLNAGIPVLTIHSLTQDTWRVLHSERDNLKAIHPDDYYTAYRVAAAYLTYLDGARR